MGTETETKLLAAMGARARARREELGLTVNDLAVKMGRTYQCIHGMERQGSLSLRVILEWAHSLQLSAETLMFGDAATKLCWPKAVELLKEAASLIDARRGRRKELVRIIREEVGGG